MSIKHTVTTSLDPDTEYAWKVRYKGANYGWSEWSDPTTFTTLDFVTGPGSSTLNYDSVTDTGYYGVVNSADLCDGSTLASNIGLSAGTLQYNDAGWLKFYVGPSADCNKDGVEKVLFIAKQTIRNDVSWNDIYNAGAVYGTGNYGPANSGSNVTQDAQVTIGGKTYKVRLLTGSATDPAAESYGNQQCSDDAGAGSEWNDLLYRVHTDVPTCSNVNIGMPGGYETTRHGGPQDGNNWASFTNAELHVYYTVGSGTYCWCQERGNNTNRRVHRGHRGVASFRTRLAGPSDSSRGWRPCLELVQP